MKGTAGVLLGPTSGTAKGPASGVGEVPVDSACVQSRRFGRLHGPWRVASCPFSQERSIKVRFLPKGAITRLGAAIWVLAGTAVAIYAFVYLYLSGYGGRFTAQFAISGYDVPLHFFFSGWALLIAPLQLVSAIRRRRPSWHRVIGGTYAAAVLIGSLAGLSLAFKAQGGPAARAAFVILALLWAAVTIMGLYRAIACDIEGHCRWMIRSVALTYAAVTLRLVLFGGVVMGWPFRPVYIAAAWLCWTLNLLVCELCLRYRPGLFVDGTRLASLPTRA